MKLSKKSKLAAVLLTFALLFGVGSGLVSAADATVSDFARLKAALGDYKVTNITLTQRIDITESIDASQINGYKIIRTDGDAHHFKVAEGLTLDFGNKAVLDGAGKSGGVTGDYYTLANVAVINVMAPAGNAAYDPWAVIRFNTPAGQTAVLDNVSAHGNTVTKGSAAAAVVDMGFGKLSIKDSNISGNASIGDINTSNVYVLWPASAVRALSDLELSNTVITGNTGGVGAVLACVSQGKTLIIDGIAYASDSDAQSVYGNSPRNIVAPYRETRPVAPAFSAMATKQVSWDAEPTPYASGELTDQIVKLSLSTTMADGYSFEWRNANDSGWNTFGGTFVFDFVTLQGDHRHDVTYVFRAVAADGTASEEITFHVNIDRKNTPEFLGLDGTLLSGYSDVYASPVKVLAEGPYASTGKFLYYDGSAYVYKTVASEADFTLTEPGSYQYAIFIDSKGHQLSLGSFFIVDGATDPGYTLTSNWNSNGVKRHYYLTLTTDLEIPGTLSYSFEYSENNVDWFPCESPAKINADGHLASKAIVYFRAIDGAGNVLATTTDKA